MRTYTECRSIQIVTPRGYILDGLRFGANTPKTAVVFVHGLASTAFAHHNFLIPIAGKNTAVLFFSNRGHDRVAGIKKMVRNSKKGYTRETAGQVHEIFTDCADDIQGAIDTFAKQKVKNIYLVGHSTGCQKIIYFLSRKGAQKNVSGAILLCPLSDYASTKHTTDPRKLKAAEKVAREFIRQNKPHELLPRGVWPSLIDAQRFLSLYTPDSKEEIFTYAQPQKTPRALRRVTVPLLSIFAENDEYLDRDVRKVIQWFEKNIRSQQSSLSVIPGALHNFNGKEKAVLKKIYSWISRN